MKRFRFLACLLPVLVLATHGWAANGSTLDTPSVPSTGTAEIDALASCGGGIHYTKATVDAAIASIGTKKQATLLLRPGTWTIDDSLIIPGNITLRLPAGARSFRPPREKRWPSTVPYVWAYIRCSTVAET